jgi:hypothetical protein
MSHHFARVKTIQTTINERGFEYPFTFRSVLVQNFVERTKQILESQLKHIDPLVIANAPNFEEKLIRYQADMHSKVQLLLNSLPK